MGQNNGKQSAKDAKKARIADYIINEFKTIDQNVRIRCDRCENESPGKKADPEVLARIRQESYAEKRRVMENAREMLLRDEEEDKAGGPDDLSEREKIGYGLMIIEEQRRRNNALAGIAEERKWSSTFEEIDSIIRFFDRRLTKLMKKLGEPDEAEDEKAWLERIENEWELIDMEDEAPKKSPEKSSAAPQEADGLNLSEESLAALTTGLMVTYGFSPEQIFDPEKGKKEHAAAEKKIRDIALAGRDAAQRIAKEEELIRINLDAAEAISRLLDNEFAQIDFDKIDSLYTERVSRLNRLISLNRDLLQERKNHPELVRRVMARKKGIDLTAPDGLAAADNASYALDRRISSQAAVAELLKKEQVGREIIQKSSDGTQTVQAAVSALLEAHLLRSLIARAQKNGVPLSEAVTEEQLAELGRAERSITENLDDSESARLLTELYRPEVGKDAASSAQQMLSQDFRDRYRFGILREGGVVRLKIRESAPGRSDAFDHAEKYEAFFRMSFARPEQKRFVPAGDRDADRLDVALRNALSEVFAIKSSDSARGRLFEAAENGALIPLELDRPISSKNREKLRDLAVSHRLFAIPEREACPVQLILTRSETGAWQAGAADCLDAPIRPVSYGVGDRLKNLLGNSEAKEKNRRYLNETARASMQASLEQIKAGRRPQISAEEMALGKELDKQSRLAGRIRKAAAENESFKEACRNLQELCGADPVYNKHDEAAGCYTKKNFDALTAVDLAPAAGEAAENAGRETIVFTDSEFIALTLAAAASGKPAQKEKAGSPELPPLLAREAETEKYFRGMAGEANADQKRITHVGKLGTYMENVLAPARKKAADAIRAYRKGNKETLAGLIAEGLAYAGRSSFNGPDDPASAAVNHYLGFLMDMEKADPELAGSVRKRAESFRQMADTARKANMAERKIPARGAAGSDTAQKQAAVYRRLDRLYGALSRFTVDGAEKKLGIERALADAVRQEAEASGRLTEAANGLRVLTAEEKKKYVRRIFEAELLKSFERENREKAASGIFSADTERLLDPKEGPAYFGKYYREAVPDEEAFVQTDADILLKNVSGFSARISAYTKKLREKEASESRSLTQNVKKPNELSAGEPAMNKK